MYGIKDCSQEVLKLVGVCGLGQLDEVINVHLDQVYKLCSLYFQSVRRPFCRV
jgi:hypothetical protein